MARGELGVEHLLRRAGFGASQDDLKQFEGMSVSAVLQSLLDFESQPDDVDSKIGTPGYASINPGTGGYSPNLNIDHARQRWLFRMVHHEAAAPGEDGALLAQPLRNRVFEDLSPGASNGFLGTRMLALKPGQLPGPPGQIELFRSMALGKLPRSADRGRQGSRDAVLARRTPEHASATAGKLRPRNHGAVHVRPRSLQRVRCLRRSQSVYRMEYADRRPWQ